MTVFLRRSMCDVTPRQTPRRAQFSALHVVLMLIGVALAVWWPTVVTVSVLCLCCICAVSVLDLVCCDCVLCAVCCVGVLCRCAHRCGICDVAANVTVL